MFLFKEICWILGSHSGRYEELYLLGYNAMLSVENQHTFRRNMSPSSSGSKNRRRKKPGSSCHLLSRCFLILFFDSEDGGDVFL
jgi:hypothetical protein